MIIGAFDLETTGLLAPEHRIIEIYVGLWHLETRSLKLSYTKRFNPQRSIDAKAQRVHGIAGADLIGQPLFATEAPTVRRLLDRADIWVAHNGEEFDGPFINMELQRVGQQPIEKPILDTMKAGRFATPDGKVPNLGELCFACDVPYSTASGKAHAADYDVHVMMQSFFRGLDWGFFSI